MKQWCIKLFLAGFVFLTPAFAEIMETPLLHPIHLAADMADQDVLFIFDIDSVLIVPKDQLLLPHYKSKIKEANDKYPEKVAQKLWSIIWLQHKVRLVDVGFLSLIHKLQDKGVKTIALTGTGTGGFGLIANFEDWRAQSLKEMGVDFSSSFANLDHLVFKNLQTKTPGQHPAFKHGILFACDVPKGDVLKAFLARSQWKPQVIVFIDDKRENLESVQSYCYQMGITFIGFHYTAVQERPIIPLNQKRTKVQLDTLQKEEKWLSDQEADELILDKGESNIKEASLKETHSAQAK